MRLIWIALLLPWLVACVSDKVVNLRYIPSPEIERLPTAHALTIFRFADRRGDEGDGHPSRVGGIYGLYGNRVAKVFSATPWPDTLVQDLTAAFGARGVEVVAKPDQEYVSGTSTVSTPLVLAGEIRNFSTEQRWTFQAHIGGIIRLHDNQGRLLIEKPLSVRMPRDNGVRLRDKPGNMYEQMLNAAVEVFVYRVVTDTDLTQRLIATR